jgi:diaminohydroxyphosphoribosylaminopyrimidine deaminase/5-amino-6-(5-phosphoribosylamino)uracil reductase
VQASTTDPATDARHMRAALALARRGLGRVWPNPAVGCVLVRDGRVVGRGWTQAGGRPHAETEALVRAANLARGACAYVSFEPCCHQGQTPPCTEALIEAGVARVVVATVDPDPRVAGAGLARLRDAGLEVVSGVLEEEARELNAGFIAAQTRARPLVALKLASTLDGKIATRRGESQWITGDAARRRGHLLRAEFDAVMIGSGTALADDPSLTCRLTGLEDRSPVRVVVDGGLRLDPASALARSAGETPAWCLTGSSDEARTATLTEHGVAVLKVAAAADGRVDLTAALEALAARGITRLLVEGGAGLAAALIGVSLVDRLYWFRAPALAGDDGLSALASLGVDRIEQLHRLVRTSIEPIADDLLETYTLPTL